MNNDDREAIEITMPMREAGGRWLADHCSGQYDWFSRDYAEELFLVMCGAASLKVRPSDQTLDESLV